MDAREAAFRFRMGDRLRTAFLEKLASADRALIETLAVFLGETKLAPRIVRLVAPELAQDFFELALAPWPEEERPSSTAVRARQHRHDVARLTLGALLEASGRRTRRAFELLRALLASDEPDAAWGRGIRAAVSSFGVDRVKELATEVLSFTEAQTLAALLADRLIWTAVHMARTEEGLRALVEGARREARSGSRRPRAAIAVARALKGVDPALARPELERLAVRVKHRVVLREVARSLAALGPGSEPELPPGAALDERGALVFEGKPDKETRRAARETLSVQRALLEQQMIHERRFSLEEWRARFLGHSVLENLARRVLWLADSKPAFFRGERFEDLRGQPIEPRELAVAHPVSLTDLERAQARARELGIEQPWKQLHRETYAVTPSELGQRACLRFVNEVVPLDLLYALTKQRGWSGLYAVAGEGPRLGSKTFAQGFRARLAVDEAQDAPGICLGPLSFETKVKRAVTVHPLGQVPPVVFSEACRDLGLVVGVASRPSS